MYNKKRNCGLLRKVPGTWYVCSKAHCSKPQQLSVDVPSLPVGNTNSQDFTCPLLFSYRSQRLIHSSMRACNASLLFCSDSTLLHSDQKNRRCIFKLWWCSEGFITNLSIQTTVKHLLLFLVQEQETQILYIKISEGQQVITLDKTNNTFEITWWCNVRLL